MGPLYYIFTSTLLTLPLISLILSRKVNPKQLIKYTFTPLIIIVIYILIGQIGYSFYGDYPEYIIVSIGYFLFSIATFSYPRLLIKKTHRLLIQIIPCSIIILLFINGLFGIVLFPTFEGDYESKIKYNFQSDNYNLETRKFQSSWVTNMYTKYSFDTYKILIPKLIEYKIDETVLRDNKTRLILDHPDSLSIQLRNDTLSFSTTNGEVLHKKIN